MIKQIRKIKPIVIAFFVIAVLLLSFNSISNKHYHKLANGEVISHSHPYHKSNSHSPFQEHSHSNTELIFLSTISNSVFIIFFIISVIIIIKFEFKRITVKQFITHTNTNFFKKNIYRGPPLNLVIGN